MSALARFARAGFAIAAIALVGAIAPVQAAEARNTLTVFAAASLSDAFTEVGKAFEKSHPGWTVRFNFAGSQQLAAQIEAGAAADIFASADERWAGYLADKQLFDGQPHVFVHNTVVLIVPRSNPARIAKLQDLARRGVKLVVGAQTVPVGAYSREVLRRLSAMQNFPTDYSPRALANVVSEEENVKAVVAKVQLGEADAGFVYRSDVTPTVARYVRVFEIPAEANVVANYPIAIVHGTRNADGAKAFIELLDSAEGKAVLERHHFMTGESAAH